MLFIFSSKRAVVSILEKAMAMTLLPKQYYSQSLT